MTSSLCFCNPSVKLDPDNLHQGMIAFGKFYKLSKFEDHVTRNDVIMMSLPKIMEKCRRLKNQSNYTLFESS